MTSPAAMAFFKRCTALFSTTLALSACNTTTPPSAATPGGIVTATPASTTTCDASPVDALIEAQALGASTQIKTRHALFKTANFVELPGWKQDDLRTAWDALLSSCTTLTKRDAWRPICSKATRTQGGPAELRRFFEQEFALFRILNADATPEGDVTGYYEPVIAGNLRAEGTYNVPVYGRPNDLYTLDWKNIPPGQRRGVVWVAKSGSTLQMATERQPSSHALDTTRFDYDTRDRNWRVQLVGDRALPYRTRAEIEAAKPLNAPVIAYVNDALALYAMQVQGSGRIRLPDGRLLRVQYAEQNGQPFKPMRLASKGQTRVLTRGLTPINTTSEDAPQEFELADPVNPSSNPETPLSDSATEGITTRGLKPASTQARPLDANQVVDQLLTNAPRKTTAANKTSIPGAPRINALNSDPSYVFFRVAADQSAASGPVGALGVPLTAGRSIAVDPRVTPLGYPVYVSAPTPTGAALPLQRLVMAQDTGGAIRGAIRADFFWGSGNDAGRLAMRTRQRGQMWLMLPHSEARKLSKSGLLTRGVGAEKTGEANLNSECLVQDEAFCSEP
jgi:membrane-bound lytic murein transglycosylase A